MSKITHIFFDAANTLIHKPLLWDRMQSVLLNHGQTVPLTLLKQKHKLLSEEIRFPDQTSKDFYRKFNAELLISLNINPEEKLVEEIFQSCTYLPWQKFEDTAILNSLGAYDLSIISNFNHSLKQTVEKEFGTIFKEIVISENHNLSKPDKKFYELALDKAGVLAGNVLYVGDSIKLDIEPALALGIQAVLIDRDLVYPNYPKRIVSLEQIKTYL